MKIDTEIRHVTKPGANLFLELGFKPAESKRLQAASRKQIDATRLLKQQLMDALSLWIVEHHLKQAEAAEILMVSRPRVSDVVGRKASKFTIDALVEMLSHIGKPVTLAIHLNKRKMRDVVRRGPVRAASWDNYAKTSTPLRSITLSNFSDGPLGRFSPISHFWTVDTLVFSTAANTI